MSRRVILDLSSWQPVPDFARITREAPEVAGVILKASEGVWGNTNPNFPGQLVAARKAGLPVGFYLFAHPNVDPAVEALTFLNRIAGQHPELGVWVDCETADGYDPQTVTAHIKTLTGLIAPHYPLRTGIYTAAWFWDPNTNHADFSSYPLWVAGYQDVQPVLPAHWQKALYWQFSQTYPVYFGQVDASVFQGTDAQWAWLTTGATPQPSGELILDAQATAAFAALNKRFDEFAGIVIHGDANADGKPDHYGLDQIQADMSAVNARLTALEAKP
jgi:GH25 family lysozyme M1 (1,4-beta-N-acetylmuramidase)